MARVFVSHAREDFALAREVHQWLTEAGHKVFLAQDLRDGIAVGEEWEQRLQKELRLADAVVCVVTSAFLASRWCTVEVATARSQGSRLLPIQAESDVADPLLQSVQHAELTRGLDAVRLFLIEALRLVDTAGGLGWPDDRSPFPGLRPFDTDQHRAFFGRTDEVQQLVQLLRSPAEQAKCAALLVVGPSGCGKSSLVRAGLLPVMANEAGWRTLSPILPGADPVAALVRELAAAARRIELDWTVAYVRHQLDEDKRGRGLTGLVDELLLADPSGPQQRLLVVVDQFEELLTQTGPTERARFVELLSHALAGPAQIVCALRPEFLNELLNNPELVPLPTHTYTLRPLRQEALRAVIEKPARLAGIDVEEHLVDRLVGDTDSGEALPLLAFTLAQLADGVSRGGQLLAARYDQLGKVQGALTGQADAALAEAVATGGRSREEVIAGLLRLVTVDEQSRPTRWRVFCDELPTPVVTELEAFIARRLLTTDTHNGAVVIGVAHEAFLSAWAPLVQAIAADVSALRARRAIEHAATEWHDDERPSEGLWGGGQLAAAITDTGARICAASASPPGRQASSRWLRRGRRVLVTDRVDVSPTACDFLHASIRRDRYRRRRISTALSVLLILALVAAGVAVYQQRDAQEHQRIATARQLITQADAIRETDPHTALLLGIAAERIHPSGATQASLVNTLTTTRYAGTLGGHNGPPVTSVALSRDGRTLATGDSNGTVILWDLTDPARPGQPLAGHTSAVSSVAFAPDGRTLATASFDGSVILWDLADPARPQLGSPLTGHADAVSSVAFAPDGRTLATASFDGSVILWDLADPARPQQSRVRHTSAVNSVAFAPDGRTLATASDDSTVILWKLTTVAPPQRLEPALTSHTSRVTDVAFSPDGRTLATASDDSTTMLWKLTDVAGPQPLAPALTSHTSRVTDVAFSPGRLATASADGTAILWDLTDRAQPQRLGQPLTGQLSPVDSVRFASDGRTLDITSSDGTVIQRDPTDPDRPSPEQPRRPSSLVDSLTLAPDGNTMVTASRDGEVILWDLSDRIQPRPLGKPLMTGHRSLVTAAAFSANGRTLATAGGDGSVILWDLSDLDQPRPLGQPLTDHRSEVTAAVFSLDGRTLATAGRDGGVILWDLTDRDQPRSLGKPLVTGHAGSVTSVALTPDGNILSTGGTDATVILWELTELNQIRDYATQRACAVTGRGLDLDQWNRYIPGLPYQDTCYR